jgi:hypothetical protein
LSPILDKNMNANTLLNIGASCISETTVHIFVKKKELFKKNLHLEAFELTNRLD